MQGPDEVAAEKLARLPRLLEWAHAGGRHELYRQLRLLNLQLLPASGWQPPPLSKADQEAARRGELFTDVREWQAALVLLKDRGYCQNVTLGDDAESEQFVQDVRRLNEDYEPGIIPRVPPRELPDSEVMPSMVRLHSHGLARTFQAGRGEPPLGAVPQRARRVDQATILTHHR
jgi:hypothetical protein